MKQLMVVLGLLCVLGIMSVGHAASVAPEQVRVAAETWMARHPDFQGATIRAWEAMPGATAHNTLYKATVSPSGFLIVNGNDVLPVVPLYSAHGGVPVPPSAGVEGDPFAGLVASIAEAGEAQCVDAETNPDAYRTQQAAWQALLPVEKKLGVRSLKTSAITTQGVPEYITNFDPYIRSYWYQNLPLSYFNPVASGGGEGGGMMIGCGATALSMLLDSHQWPAYGQGVLEYDYFSDQMDMRNFHGYYEADLRAKFHFADFITSARGGPMYNLIESGRFGWSIAVALNSGFGLNGTGSSYYNKDEFERYAGLLRYTGDRMTCGPYWQSLMAPSNIQVSYNPNWKAVFIQSLREHLPVLVSLKYGTYSHAIVADGLRETVDSNNVTNQMISLNYGYGYNFWVDFATFHPREDENTDEPGQRYINSIVAHLRPRPVPLPDPVPRQSNPDTVVSWEIPKHYVEMQSNIITQRVKIITAGSMDDVVTYPLTNANSEVVLYNPAGEDVYYNSVLRFDNYNQSQETVTFTKGFAVSENSEIIFNLDVQNQVNNRTLRVLASLDGTNWSEVWFKSFTGRGDGEDEFGNSLYATFTTSTQTISLASYAGKTIQFRIQADYQDDYKYAKALRISDLRVTGLVSLGAPTYSDSFPAQRYNSMKLRDIPGLTMPTGSESKYYKFRIELFADQKRGAGPRWYPTSLENGSDDPNCPDNDTWIETYIANDNPGTLPSLSGVPLKMIATGTTEKETIIPLPIGYTYDCTVSTPRIFNVALEPTTTNTLLKVSVKSDYPFDRSSSYRQQNALLTLITTDTDGNTIYTSHALCARPDTYETWPTNTTTAVSAAGRNQAKILRYTGPSRPDLSAVREMELAGAFSLLYVEDATQTEPEWMFCASDGRELFTFGTDTLREIYINSVINRTQPVLPSGMTFNATGDLSDASHDWIVESGATMPANQRIYRVTFKSGSTIAYVPGSELNVVKGCTFETNVTAFIASSVTEPQAFILSETANTGRPEPSQNHIAVANENKEYILVQDETVHVSYHANVAGRYATWEAVPFVPNDFGEGASYKRVAFTPTATARVPLSCTTPLTMYSLTVNEGEPLTFSGDCVVTSGVWNLVASRKVTLDCSTGDAPIIAGSDTILKRTGTGMLTINTGKQATLDGITWADANLVNNGTLVYAGNQANVMPRTSGVQVIATPMAWTSAFDWRGPLLTVQADTTTGTFSLRTSNSSVTVDGATLTMSSFGVEGDNLSPTIRVINGGQFVVNGTMKMAHFTSGGRPVYEVVGAGSRIQAKQLKVNTWGNSSDQTLSLIDGGTLSIGSGGITRHNHGGASTGYKITVRAGIITAYEDWHVIDENITYPARCEIRISAGSTATLDPDGHTITYNRNIVDDEPDSGAGSLIIGRTGGSGTVVLTKANTFTGGTTLAGGNLWLKHAEALGPIGTNALSTANGTTLTLDSGIVPTLKSIDGTLNLVATLTDAQLASREAVTIATVPEGTTVTKFIVSARTPSGDLCHVRATVTGTALQVAAIAENLTFTPTVAKPNLTWDSTPGIFDGNKTFVTGDSVTFVSGVASTVTVTRATSAGAVSIGDHFTVTGLSQLTAEAVTKTGSGVSTLGTSVAAPVSVSGGTLALLPVAKTFRFIRWHITANRGGASAGVQLARFSLFDSDGNRLSLSESNVMLTNSLACVNIPNGQFTKGEKIANIFNDNLNSKWFFGAGEGAQSLLNNGGIYFVLDLGASAPQVASYSFTSANDVDARDPYTWTLDGSNDGTTWQTLHTMPTMPSITRKTESTRWSLPNLSGATIKGTISIAANATLRVSETNTCVDGSITFAEGSSLELKGQGALALSEGSSLTASRVTVLAPEEAPAATARLFIAADTTTGTWPDATVFESDNSSIVFAKTAEGYTIHNSNRIPAIPPYVATLTGNTTWTAAPWQDSSNPTKTVVAADWNAPVTGTSVVTNNQVASTLTLDRSISMENIEFYGTQPLTFAASEGAVLTADYFSVYGALGRVTFNLPLTNIVSFVPGPDSVFNCPVKGQLYTDNTRMVFNFGTNYEPLSCSLFSWNVLNSHPGTGQIFIGDGVKSVSLSMTDVNTLGELWGTQYNDVGAGDLTVNTNAALALSTLWKGATTVYGSLRSSGKINGTLTFDGGTLIAQTNTCLEVTGAVTGSAQIDVSALGNSTNRIAVLKAPGITTTGFTVPTPYALTVDANTLYVQSAEVRVIFAGADATEVSLEEPVRHYLTEKFHAAREDAPTLPTVVRLQAVTQDGAVVHTGSLAAEVTQMLELTPEFTADGDTTRATVAYEFRCDDFQLTTGGVKLSARLDSAHKQHGAINGRLVIQKCLPNGTWEDVPDSAQSGPTFTREGTSGAWRFAHDYLLTLPEHNCMFRVIIKP